MNELIIFKNPEFGSIRTMELNGEFYFVGKDVAEALGYVKARNAIATHVEDEDKKDALIQGGGGMQTMTIINESGVYALIFGSKLESAKRFKHWVTSEILPSIRKTGGYIAGQETMSDTELLAKALLVAQKQIENRNKKIEEMQPKALFADAVAASKTSILIGDLAKLIRQNGYNIGQNRLFEWLRNNDYLIKHGSSKNMPMQKYVDQGLFEIKESTIHKPDGSIWITRTTKVTGKGQIYFVNKILGEQKAP